MHIEQIALSDIAKWPRNPKQHDIGAIIESIKRFGFKDPMTKDVGTGRLVEGHGRLEALQEMKKAGEPPPENITVGEGEEWQAPVVHVTFRSEEDAEAFVIAANRTVILGGWNENELIELLKKHAETPAGLKGIGYDGDDLDDMIAQLGQTELAHRDFKGGYAEGEEATRAREGQPREGSADRGLREIVLLMEEDDHSAFTSFVRKLREVWQMENTAKTVLQAVRQAVDHL